MAKKKKQEEILADKTIKERVIIDRFNELEYDTDHMSAASLMTNIGHTNSSRLIMWAHNSGQWVSIKDPELPNVPTGFEKVLGSYSSMIDQADHNYEIVAKFQKNTYNYVLIGLDRKHGIYHAWKRQEVEEHSEGHCTRYNNQYMDSLEPGDIVKKGSYIKKSTNFDKDMNYQYGKNLNTVYMVSAQVLEDGIQLMNGAENIMNSYHVERREINLADNEILLNWNGDDNEYRGIPRIGERTRKGILCAVRRIDNAKAPYALKKKRLKTIERGDRKYYGEGRVIDIDILYNKDRDKISEAGAYRMIKELYDRQQAYYHDLCKYMLNIIDICRDSDDLTYTDEFAVIYQEAFNYIDAGAYFADGNDSVFGNMMIRVTLLHEEPLIIGSKLVGRYGNKGVITKILPPEKSWKMEDGRPIHVVVAALGVVGRLNPSQLNEHSINELSNTAVEMMKQTDDLDKKCGIVYRLMKYLNSDEADAFKKFYKNLDESKKRKFTRRIEREGIIIIQEPIHNANVLDIGKAYKEFPANYQKIVFDNGKKSIHRVLCAKMFFIRLKQDPLDKYSLRSRGPINPLTNSPAKSNAKKKGQAYVSDVAVRFGEYEMEVMLAMVNHPGVVSRFMSENSTSWPAKMVIAEQTYLGDLNSGINLSEVKNIHEGKKNMEAIQAYINVLGSTIEIDTEKAKPGEYYTD